MVKTIIQWNGYQPFTDEEIEQLKITAEQLAGPEYRLGTLIFGVDGNLTVTRNWPSQEIAEAWLAHIAKWNPVNTVIIPD